MAQVPVYGGTQVRSNALQPVQQGQVDVSSGLRAVGQGLAQVGDAVDKIAERQIETDANRIDTEVTAGWLKWDAENRRKYQGQDVDTYQAEAEKWWSDQKGKYAEADVAARGRVGPALARKQAQALGSVYGHVNAEKDRFADTQAEAAAVTTIEFGVDTGDAAGAAARVRQIAAEKGARKGWSTELVQAEQQRLLGTLHLSMIQSMAEADPAKASAYYAANKGEIPAAAQTRVEQVLKGEAENQQAKQMAMKNATLPLSEQLAAGADLPPATREKYLTEVRNNYAMRKAVDAEREGAASDEAWQLVGKGRRVPETVLMRMNGKERVQLQDHLQAKAKQAASGESTKTDWGVYLAAREQLAAGEKVDLRLLTTKVAPAQLEQLVDIQTKSKTPAKAAEVATSEQQLSAYTREMGLNGERVGQFQSAAYDRFNMHLKAKGKEPTYDERQVILDQLTKDVVTSKGFIWDSKAPAYQAPKAVRDQALPPIAPADKFTTGQVYTDKNGARAKYLGGGKWEPIK